jgi:hypothetical protein
LSLFIKTAILILREVGPLGTTPHLEDVHVPMHFHLLKIRARCKDFFEFLFLNHFLRFRSYEGWDSGFRTGFRLFLNYTVFDNKTVFRAWSHGCLGGGEEATGFPDATIDSEAVRGDFPVDRGAWLGRLEGLLEWGIVIKKVFLGLLLLFLF